VVGLSILSGAHMALFPKIVKLLKEEGAADKLIIGGGIIPEDDMAELKKMGIAEIFGPGTTTETIVDYVKDAMASRRE
jgi:methylmalonyl-CoA mutase C-terminal domain/subunit